MNTTVSKNRLKRLADFLSKLPKEKFSISRWVVTPKGSTDINAPKVTCNSTACAVGWAGSIPAFKKAGLKMRYWGDGLNDDTILLEPVYKGAVGYRAAETFFGLTEGEAHHLFAPGAYSYGPSDRTTVVKRIRNFVRRKRG